MKKNTTKKGAAKERAEEQKYWTRALAHDLLPALDNLERAIAAAGAEGGPRFEKMGDPANLHNQGGGT